MSRMGTWDTDLGIAFTLPNPVSSGSSGGWFPCPLASSSSSMMSSGNLEFVVAQGVSGETGGGRLKCSQSSCSDF